MARITNTIDLTDRTDERLTFTSTDTSGKTYTYRAHTVFVYDDGSVRIWSAQITKAGRPYKNGMGVHDSVERMGTYPLSSDSQRMAGRVVRQIVAEH